MDGGDIFGYRDTKRLNMALLVQKGWDFFCQNPFSAILKLKRKKVPMA